MNGSKTLNWAGVRREGRMKHLDAVGLLLWAGFRRVDVNDWRHGLLRLADLKAGLRGDAA